MCTVVNLRTSAYTVYIGRPGRGQQGLLGNPFIVGVHGARGQCVTLFEHWFRSNEPDAIVYRTRVQQIIKPSDVLGCFCKPAACHGDVIARYVNNNYQL